MSETNEVVARGLRTRAVVDDVGWLWVGLRPWLVRAAGAAVALPGMLLAALLAVVSRELPTVIALPLVVLLLGGVAAAGLAVWRLGQAGAGVSPIGVALQVGLRPTELAWRTIERVVVAETRASGLVRVTVEHDGGITAVPVRLDPPVAVAWLERAATFAPHGTQVDSTVR